MNLKLKYSLLFNLFIALILLVSCLSIYILYKNYRTTDFNQRLTNEINNLYGEINLITLSDSLYLNFAYKLNSNNLNNESITIAKSATSIVYNLPGDSILDILKNDSIYNIIKKNKIHAFTIKDREAVGQYFEENGIFIFVSAVDKTGFRKQQKLAFILIVVFCMALIVSIIITFLFIGQALQPLEKLSMQISDTTISNLTKKVDEGKGNNEINRIARNFNAMLQRLNDAFEGQKTFVQNASHELRTPLATMLSQTEAALNRKLTIADYKNVLESLKEDQTNLIELTNSLLLISQYEKINFLTSWPEVRIDELLYETVATCKRMFQDCDITLDFKTIPENESDLLVRSNDTLLKSAFRNLIKNAYLYSNNKKVIITIEINEHTIAIAFINTGIQLSEVEINKMKIPFFRGSNATSKKGYGLGLSIVNKIIELHKGFLKYETIGADENKFIITIPIA